MLQSQLPGVVNRFLRYVSVDTTADPESAATPSSEGQLVLGAMLARELRDLGASNVLHDDNGYVYATLPALGAGTAAPPVALFAHLDTSPDAPGDNVKPMVHGPFDGQPVRLPGNPDVVLDPAERADLKRFVGHNLITSDGTTLLGSDDKAGVAIMMQLAEDGLQSNADSRPEVRLVFTVDEEIGRGVDKIDMSEVRAQIGYTLDGSDIDTVYTDTFNAARATITFTGRMVHPGYATGIMINAATAAASFVTSLPNERPENTSGDDGFYYVRLIDAPSSDSARVAMLLRDFDKHGMQQRKDIVNKLAAQLQARHPGLGVTVSIEDEYENMREYIERVDDRAITYAIDAARAMGVSLQTRKIRGGTDGARLSAMGLPTPNVFNGGHDYHSVYEWNTVQSLERSLLYTKALLARWAAD